MSSKTEKDPNTTTIRARRSTSQTLGSLVRQYQDNPEAIPASLKTAIGDGPVNGPVVLEAAVARLAEESKRKPSPKSKMSSARRNSLRGRIAGRYIFGIKVVPGVSVDDALDDLDGKVEFADRLTAEESKLCGGAEIFCMPTISEEVAAVSSVMSIIDLPFLEEEKNGRLGHLDHELPEVLKPLPRIMALVTKRFPVETLSLTDGQKAGFRLPDKKARQSSKYRKENEGKTKFVLLEIACDRAVASQVIRMLHSVGIAAPVYIPSATGEVDSPSSFDHPIRVVCSTLAGDLIENLLLRNFNTKPGQPSAMIRSGFRGRVFGSPWEIESLLQDHREYRVELFGRNERNSFDHCESFCYAVDLLTGNASSKDVRWILAYSEGNGGVPPEVTVGHTVPGGKEYHRRGVKPVIDGTKAWSLVDERFAGPTTDSANFNTFRLGAFCDAQGKLIASKDPYDVLVAALSDRPFGIRLETIRALAANASTMKRKELDAAIDAAGEAKTPVSAGISAAEIARVSMISNIICAEAVNAIRKGLTVSADEMREAVRARLVDQGGERYEDRYEYALNSLQGNKVIHPLTETDRSIRFI